MHKNATYTFSALFFSCTLFISKPIDARRSRGKIPSDFLLAESTKYVGRGIVDLIISTYITLIRTELYNQNIKISRKLQTLEYFDFSSSVKN